MFRGRRRHQPTQLMGVGLLLMQLFNFGIDRIPPVTLSAIALQVALFVRLLRPPWTRHEACISVKWVLRHHEYSRLVLSAVEHADDWHLYYNMVSLLWKGSRLERRTGSVRFLVTLLVLSVCCGVVYIALALGATFLLHDHHYSEQCAIGFSGVLFALKVLLQQMTSGDDRLVSWGVWSEVVLIQLVAPRSSLLGHAAGVIAGLWFTRGPLLKSLTKSIATFILNLLDQNVSASSYNRPRFRGGGQPSGYGWRTGFHDNSSAEWQQQQQQWEDDGSRENLELSEAMQRSRESYQQELERRRFSPSAPPYHF